MISSIAATTRLAVAAQTPPTNAPAGPVDQVTIGKMQKKAERLHAAGDMLGMGMFFGMPVYAFPSFMLAQALYPALGTVGQVGTCLLAAGGLLGSSLYCTHKGNEVRAQAEELNKQIPNAQPLDWSWAVRNH